MKHRLPEIGKLFSSAVSGLLCVVVAACQSSGTPDTTLSDTLAAGIEPVTIGELLANGEQYNQRQIWVRGLFYRWPGRQLCVNETTLEQRRLPDEEKKCIPIAYTNTSVDPPDADDGEEIALEISYSQFLCKKDAPCWIAHRKIPEGGFSDGDEHLKVEESKDRFVRMLVLLDPPGSDQKVE